MDKLLAEVRGSVTGGPIITLNLHSASVWRLIHSCFLHIFQGHASASAFSVLGSL